MRTQIWGTGPKGTLEYVSAISSRIGAEATQIKKISIKAQEKALIKPGDRAPEFFMENGVLYIKDVGKFAGNFEEFLSVWAKGSIRMRTVINDIKPGNIGKNGLIFDPALIPLEKALDLFTKSTPGLICFGGKYYLIEFEVDILEK